MALVKRGLEDSFEKYQDPRSLKEDISEHIPGIPPKEEDREDLSLREASKEGK
jgi:hypothetical protein